jgi:hypothetical protein
LIGIALVLVKLWLVSGQTLQALGSSPHDDRLFLKLASSLLQGDWLGPYSDKTLAKGPFYSLFIAGVFLLGVPLFTAKHLLYSAACALLVRSLRPLQLGPVFCLILFGVLLFNPVTYDTGNHLRVLRQTLIPLLTVFILAGLLGLLLRSSAAPRRLLPWAVGLGLTLSAFWLTREESVWILPLVICVGTQLLWSIWRLAPALRRPRYAVLALVPALWAAGPLLVATLNFSAYGVFTTCEFKTSEFKAAYGALTRVRPHHWQPLVPVARETRQRIYAVSPEFTRLEPFLEHNLGDNYAKNSGTYGLPPDQQEITGGQFLWALRDSVHHAGLAPDGAQAMAYYARLAAEVNAACDTGRLDATSSRRATMLPPLVPAYRPLIYAATRKAVPYAIGFEGLQVKSMPSRDEPEKRAFFQDLTRERLSPAPGDVQLLVAQPIMDRIRTRLLAHILTAYQALVPWAGLAAGVAWLAATLFALRRRHLTAYLPLGLGLLGSNLALIFIAVLVDATSFHAIHPGYLTGFYGLHLVWILLAAPAFKAAQSPLAP